MAKDPAVLLYTSDFITGTNLFTDDECGKYIRLLCQQHQTGRLPESYMIKILESKNSLVWSKFILDENGFWYNERMEKEAIKRAKYCETRRNNISGTNQYTKNKRKRGHMTSHMNGHMENGNDNVNKDINSNRNKEEDISMYKYMWDDFYDNYFGAKSRKSDFENFKKKNKDWKEVLLLLTPAVKKEAEYKNALMEANLFCPQWKNLTTWINQKCWEQDFPEIVKTNKETTAYDEARKFIEKAEREEEDWRREQNEQS